MYYIRETTYQGIKNYYKYDIVIPVIGNIDDSDA